MSSTIDRARAELIKARILRQLAQQHRERGMADIDDAIRHGSPLPSHTEPDKPLPDVPLDKRGFGVMEEDAP
jgi:hypothetical protein